MFSTVQPSKTGVKGQQTSSWIPNIHSHNTVAVRLPTGHSSSNSFNSLTVLAGSDIVIFFRVQIDPSDSCYVSLSMSLCDNRGSSPYALSPMFRKRIAVSDCAKGRYLPPAGSHCTSTDTASSMKKIAHAMSSAPLPLSLVLCARPAAAPRLLPCALRPGHVLRPPHLRRELLLMRGSSVAAPVKWHWLSPPTTRGFPSTRTATPDLRTGNPSEHTRSSRLLPDPPQLDERHSSRP